MPAPTSRPHVSRSADLRAPGEPADGELSTIEVALDRAETGSGTVLYLEGPAGIGKSHLLHAAAAAAAGRGATILSAAGRAPEQELGYGVVVQLFEPVWLTLDADEQAQLCEGPAGPAARLISGADPAGSQELTIIRGLMRIAGDLAATGPGLMVLIDDARRADAPSLRFVSYLAARAREVPVVLAVAARPAVSGAAEGVLAAVRAQADVILRPPPLTTDEAARIIADTLPGGEPGLTDACMRLTGGNPFLLKALLAEAGARGGTPSGRAIEELVPPGAVALVSDELRDLGTSARGLARAISVLEAPVSLAQAGPIAGLHAEEAARAADALADIHVLEPGEPLRFTCELLSNAVRASIPEAQRAMAMRGEMSVREPARIETASPAQAVRALVTGDALEQALVLLETPDLLPGRSSDLQTEAALGAWRAWSRYHQGAVTDALAAVQATADVLAAAGAPASALAGVIAACRVQLGELDHAEEALRVLQTPEELAPHERPMLLEIRAQLRLAQKQPHEALIDALEAGRQARVAGADADPGLVSWRSTAALARLDLGEPAGARQLAEEELELARGGDVRRVTIRCLRVLGLAAVGRHRLDLLEDAVALGTDAPVRLEYLHALVDLGAVHRRANRRAAAREPLSDALELCHERGATALADRAKAEIAAAGNGRRSEIRRSGLQTLTPSERRVGTLAAQGHTTRQIAGELFVSTKTVEFHLRHIYRKLEIGSTRAELTRALGGRGDAAENGSESPPRSRDLLIGEEGDHPQ